MLVALPQAARTHLESLMATGTYDYQSEFTERLRTEGRAEAKADDVLRVLRVRGLDVPDEIRERITGCSDLDQLDRWLEQAITADSVHELIG